MKRTPLRRKTSLRAKTKLRPVNRKRRAQKFERNFGAKATWIRSLPCLRCQLPGDHGVQAAHVRARGMGGCGGDSTDLVPLCDVRGCHREQEALSVSVYLHRTGIDLEAEAKRLDMEWNER